MPSTNRELMLDSAHRLAEFTDVVIACSSIRICELLHKEHREYLRSIGVEFTLCMNNCISMKNGHRIFFRPFTGTPDHMRGYDAYTMFDHFDLHLIDHHLQYYLNEKNLRKIEGDPNIANILRTYRRN